MLPSVPVLFTGQPVARLNSTPELSAETVWVVLLLGYEFCPICSDPLFAGQRVTQPRISVLAALDQQDGSLLSHTEIRDTSGDTISIGAEGSVYPSHSSISSSIFFYGINPLLESLGGVVSGSPSDVVAAVIAAVGAHAGETAPSDDLTALALRFRSA